MEIVYYASLICKNREEAIAANKIIDIAKLLVENTEAIDINIWEMEVNLALLVLKNCTMSLLHSTYHHPSKDPGYRKLSG